MKEYEMQTPDPSTHAVLTTTLEPLAKFLLVCCRLSQVLRGEQPFRATNSLVPRRLNGPIAGHCGQAGVPGGVIVSKKRLSAGR